MKRIISILFFILALSCYKNKKAGNNDPPPNNGGNTDCGTLNGYTLYKDAQGCYYNGSNYSKVYVDASNCTCQ
ncbi:MAG TPA: hypothetical protein VM101_13135 [Flavitalea sp.]|nr:hypothetical protein [Flavitalea sp.]